MASWKPRENASLERVVVTLPPEKMRAVLAEVAKILYNHFSQSDFIAPSSISNSESVLTTPKVFNKPEVV